MAKTGRMPHSQVLIIGGGPAGTAAALTLAKRPDISVRVLERSTYTAPRIGESLSPGARELLHYLGVWEVFDAEQRLSLMGNQAAWGSSDLGAMDFIFTLHGPGWALHRLGFDAMLAREAAARGAAVETGVRVLSLDHDGTRWTAKTDQGDFTADYVIDAAGRTSPFAPAGYHRQRNDTLTALAARMPRGAEVPNMTRVEAFDRGWWYVSPVPHRPGEPPEVIVCLFADAASVHGGRLAQAEAWQAALNTTQHIRAWIAPGAGVLEIEAHAAFSSLLIARPAADGDTPSHPYVAAGDAAAARDPLSSSGIANALGTGIQAARVAADGLFGHGQMQGAYAHALAQDHSTYLRAHWKTYAVEKRWPQMPFWRFRTAQISRGPEEMVKLKATEADGGSIFLPAPTVRWIRAKAMVPCRQLDLLQGARLAFPQIPDERLLLGIEELTVPA